MHITFLALLHLLLTATPLHSQEVSTYHELSKHYFDHYALSSDHMDWKNQPTPHRTFGQSITHLPFPPTTTTQNPKHLYSDLFTATTTSKPFTFQNIADLLYFSFALSGKKKAGRGDGWNLRVNPSSGNLHPVEVYLLLPPDTVQAAETPGLYHYNALHHGLEQRATFSSFPTTPTNDTAHIYVALTAVFWRQSWKYGVRAFRYCELDIGHAIAALSLAAKRNGWHLEATTELDAQQLDQLLGLNERGSHQGSYPGEQEESEILFRLSKIVGDDEEGVCRQEKVKEAETVLDKWVGAKAVYHGRANHLSPAGSHHAWPQIRKIADATKNSNVQQQ